MDVTRQGAKRQSPREGNGITHGLGGVPGPIVRARPTDYGGNSLNLFLYSYPSWANLPTYLYSYPIPNVRVILNNPPPYTSGSPYSSEVWPPAPRGGYLHPPAGQTACAAQAQTPPQVRELGLGGLAPGPGARALGRGAVIGSILRVGQLTLTGMGTYQRNVHF